MTREEMENITLKMILDVEGIEDEENINNVKLEIKNMSDKKLKLYYEFYGEMMYK